MVIPHLARQKASQQVDVADSRGSPSHVKPLVQKRRRTRDIARGEGDMFGWKKSFHYRPCQEPEDESKTEIC